MATRVGCIFYHLSAFHVTFHQQFEANEASLTMMMLFKPHLEFASKRGNTGIEESPKFLTSKFWFQVNLQGIAILCTGSQNLLRIGRPDSLACGNWNILQNTLLIEKQLNVVFVHSSSPRDLLHGKQSLQVYIGKLPNGREQSGFRIHQ